MIHEHQPLASHRRLSRFVGVPLLILAAAAIWLASLFFLVPADLSLDSSWQAALCHAWKHRLVYGRDVVFTYGPWGWLTFPSYHADTFSLRMAWELFSRAVAAGLLVALLPSLNWPRRITLVAYGLLIMPLFPDTSSFLVITGLTLWLARSKKPHAAAIAAAGALLGLLALQKFSFLVLGACGAAGAMLQHAAARRWRTLAWIAAGLGASVVAWWLAAGQPLDAFPFFVQRSLWISSGYTEAMFLAPPAPAFAAGLLCCALFPGLIWAGGLRSEWPVALALTGAGYLSWKHGFVRADGHMLGFFSTMIAVSVAAPLLLPFASSRRAVASWALLVVALLGCVATAPGLMAILPRLLAAHVAESSSRIFALDALRTELARHTVQVAAENPLPAVRAVVGTATVDQFGYEQALLFFNSLNYHPRPVPQGYQTYSGPLARLNEQFYTSAAAPAFTLARVQTIDNRLAAMDDARLLLRLILDHDLVLAEQGCLLLRHHPAISDPRPKLLRTGNLHYNEVLDLPSEGRALWLRLDPAYSWLGRLRTMLYQPPEVTLRLTDANGRVDRFRMVAPASRAGFLISPVLNNTQDLQRWMEQGAGRIPRAVRLEIPSGAGMYFKEHATFELFSLDAVRYRAAPTSQ